MAVFRPSVMSKRIGYANFGAFAASLLRQSGFDGSTPNPNTDPSYSRSRKDQLQRLLGIDWYYGGWMEDRSIVWSDTYLKNTGNFLHLGIDCSVGAGTEVLAVADGPVVHVGDDTPLVGGWGGHVVQLIPLRGETHALIYAHLDSATCGGKRDCAKGDVIGLVGTKDRNGFWGEHVHLQLYTGIGRVTDWREFIDGIDGYGNAKDIAHWARTCPDPTPLIF